MQSGRGLLSQLFKNVFAAQSTDESMPVDAEDTGLAHTPRVDEDASAEEQQPPVEPLATKPTTQPVRTRAADAFRFPAPQVPSRTT